MGGGGGDFGECEGFLPFSVALDEKVGGINDVPVLVELVDASDAKIQFLLLKVSTQFQTYFLPLASPSIPVSFRMGEIMALNVILARSGTFGIKHQADRTGILNVRLNGLPFLAAGAQGDITELPLLEPIGFQSGPIEAPTATVDINVLSRTFMVLHYEGETDGSFGGVAFSFDDPDTSNPIELGNLDQLFPNGIVFQVNYSASAQPVSSMDIEIKDADGKVWRSSLLHLQSFPPK